LEALKKWRHYFFGGRGQLIIKTNQQSLKHMMNQKLNEGIQHKLLLKLLEFSYSIEYKKGVDNSIADALSRKDVQILAITYAIPSWIFDVENSYTLDPHYKSLIEQLLVNDQSVPQYSIHSSILRHNGRIGIGSHTDLRTNILSSLHSSPIGGHSGIRATYQRVKRIFHWPKLKQSVEAFVSE
jgi:hypothetical protein